MHKENKTPWEEFVEEYYKRKLPEDYEEPEDDPATERFGDRNAYYL